MTLALALLVAAAALAIFSVSAPVGAEAEDGDVLFGTCIPGSGGKPATPPICHSEVVGQAEVLGLKAVQISAGSDHAYALKADGTLIGWGVSADGRLDMPALSVNRGNDVRTGRDDPGMMEIGPDDRPAVNEDGQQAAEGNRYLVDQEPVRWSAVAAGNLHTCAITTEGEVYCWGDNSRQQSQIPIGLLGTSADAEIPSPRFTKIVAGGYHTCVLEAETTIDVAPMREGGADTIPAGSIVCWGDNSSGQAGVPGSPGAGYGPPLPNDPGAGLGGVAARTNGAIGDGEDATTPIRGDQILYVDVTAGANHTCAVRTTGLVDCWGSNSHGQIRVPMQLLQPQPALIDASGSLVRSGEFHSIEAGENFTCAINREGGALCWGSNDSAQEYPPAGEYTQLSAGRWHACAISTFDDFPLREVNPEAPEPASRVTTTIDGMPVTEPISLAPPTNMDCWGQDLGSGRTVPPTSVLRRTDQGALVRISSPRWNQVSAGGTFSCGIFDMGGSADAPPPANAEQAVRFSATAAVSEGVVHCWGMIEPAPAPDVIGRFDIIKEVCTDGEPAVDPTDAVAQIPDGWGRIHGRVAADGSMEFAFRVVQTGPDIWIDPQFRWVPRDGNLTVGRWYYSEVMTVSAHADRTADGTPFGETVACDCQDMMIGRIAVRLLRSGHMQLALMTRDGQVMANVPPNHDRIPTPAEPGKWWSTDFIKWYDAP